MYKESCAYLLFSIHVLTIDNIFPSNSPLSYLIILSFEELVLSLVNFLPLHYIYI